jgi:hypothetical protein
MTEALDARLRGFHDVGVAEVLDVVGYLRDTGDTVIAGGSLTFGLGNRLSDFDVVICGAQTSRSLVPLEHWVKTLRVDVWTRSHDDVDKLFVLAREALDRDTPIGGAFGSIEQEQQLKLLHRIAFGLELDGPALAPASVPDFRAVARDLVVREYAERLRESLFVARSATRTGRWLAAVSNAREAVEEAFTVVLTSRGVPFTGDKWLHERLRSHAPDLREAYRRFAALPTADRECAAYVGDALALATRLTGLTGEGEPGWQVDGLELCKTGDTHVLVAPRHGTVHAMSDVDVKAWEERDTDFCFGLYERGLAKPDWTRGVPLGELTIAGESA